MKSVTTFDPDLGAGTLQFKCTDIRVIDPAKPLPHEMFGNKPNHVLDPNKTFKIEVDWEGAGWLLDLWMPAMEDNWVIKAFAETVGPGDDVALVTNSLKPQLDFTGGMHHRKWTHTLDVPAGLLSEGNPDSDNSGVYQISVTLFANTKHEVAQHGYDISGFAKKSITVRVEDPV